MTDSPELFALQQSLAVCYGHENALRDALEDLKQRQLRTPDLEPLMKEDRRLLDQFAYRYTRLQDDMGARLIPGILKAMGEEVALMTYIDRLNRLEQLKWLPSADEWSELRRIRNEFTHEYPRTPEERLEKLGLAIDSAYRIITILGCMKQRIETHFR